MFWTTCLLLLSYPSQNPFRSLYPPLPTSELPLESLPPFWVLSFPYPSNRSHFLLTFRYLSQCPLMAPSLVFQNSYRFLKDTFSWISWDLNEETAVATYNSLDPRLSFVKSISRQLGRWQNCPWAPRVGTETAKLGSELFPINDPKTAKEGP